MPRKKKFSGYNYYIRRGLTVRSALSFLFCFFFSFCDLFCQSRQKEDRKNSGQRVNANKVEPNAVKSKAPKSSEEKDGEDECRSHRYCGCLHRLSNSAKVALRCNAYPTEEVGEAEKTNGVR